MLKEWAVTPGALRVLSYGVDSNSYGHPHLEQYADLATRACYRPPTLRTGALVIDILFR